MGQQSFHIGKAGRNKKFYDDYKLESCAFDEWAVVVLFYITVHYVDAVLSQDTSLPSYLKHPMSHVDRRKGVAQCTNLAPIALFYSNLEARSRDARYTELNFKPGYVTKLESTCYQPMKQYFAKTLKLS